MGLSSQNVKIHFNEQLLNLIHHNGEELRLKCIKGGVVNQNLGFPLFFDKNAGHS